MDAIERVVGAWRARGVALNKPASTERVEQLGGMFDGTVPMEIRRFFSLADGMPEYSTDGFHLSFWSIDRIIRESDVATEGQLRWVAFADFLIYSHCIRVARIGSEVAVAVDDSAERFPSLATFFDRYLSNPETFGMQEAG